MPNCDHCVDPFTNKQFSVTTIEKISILRYWLLLLRYLKLIIFTVLMVGKVGLKTIRLSPRNKLMPPLGRGT